MYELYNATAGNVVDFDCVEFNILLGFGVSISRKMKINLGIPKLNSDVLSQKALRCMIILLGGGKKVLLELCINDAYVSVYVVRKANPQFMITIGGITVLDVNAVMKELYQKEFSAEYLVENILKIDK